MTNPMTSTPFKPFSTITSISAVASVLGIAMILAPNAEAQVRSYNVRANAGSRIQFVSDAPLERTTGVSSNVTGQLRFDPANLRTASGTIRVQISSLRTGIDLRDSHLRGSGWLDASRFPHAIFELVAIEGATSLTPNTMTTVRLRGRFTLHGQTREVVANARLHWTTGGPGGDLLRAQASFQIQLSDFGVAINPVVRLKVSNQIAVNVNIRAAP